MKRILTLLMAFCCYSISYGKEVTQTDAKNVGYNYLVQKGAVVSGLTDLNLLYTAGTAPEYFYVFGNSSCFVIVAAEDAVTPILGYSKTNSFGTGKLPANIDAFFQGYSRQIKYIKDNNAAATEEITSSWYNLAHGVVSSHSTAKTTSVSPLLSTTWDQYPYYNAQCPADASAADFGGTDVTGCVATAMAQVMKFWNWPTTGVGLSSYASSYGTLSANYGATTYNWSAMPNSLTGSNAAVATLMYHAGVSVDMQYTASESGAYVISATSPITNCAEYALKTYFNYASTLHGVSRSDYSDAAWNTLLEAELTAGRPTICDGDGTAGGHCFVFDGFESGDMFHVNWGWSGNSDGYFTIDALNPPALGAGGGGGGFNSDQEAIIGITPNTTTVAASGICLASTVSLSAGTISYGATFSVTAKIKNAGTTAFSGAYTALIFDASSALIDSVQVEAGTLAVGATTSLLTFTSAGLLDVLPGTYTIVIYDRATGATWSAVNNAGSYTNAATLTVTNSNFIEVYSPMVATPATMVQGSAASVTFEVANNSADDWNDSLDLSLFNLDGSFACEIQSLAATDLPSLSYTSPGLTFATANITAAPGTYFMACEFRYSGSWYLAGADFAQNPVYVTVVAPPLSPDMYEVNNTAATAYTLPLTFVSNVATKSTTGANFHIVTDQDYYKVVLPAGYNYAITARVNDDLSSDDGATYTADATWSYSTDGGSTWSSVYDDVMPGTINISGGTVIFHVVPHYAGNTGSYILKLSNVTRTSTSASSVSTIDLDAVKVFPTPATDLVTIDLTGTDAHATAVSVTDMSGRKMYEVKDINQTSLQIPVSGFANGIYLVTLTTTEGTISKKITVNNK